MTRGLQYELGLYKVHGLVGDNRRSCHYRARAAFSTSRAAMIAAIIFGGLLVAGVVKKIMSKQQVAIFSADRKATQGKQPNVITRTFKSKPQAGKINTHYVGSTLGPQNPGSVPQ